MDDRHLRDLALGDEPARVLVRRLARQSRSGVCDPPVCSVAEQTGGPIRRADTGSAHAHLCAWRAGERQRAFVNANNTLTEDTASERGLGTGASSGADQR